jgi:predicted phage-related endonuclease
MKTEQQWLSERRSLIGASEAGAILEQWNPETQSWEPLSEFADAYQVYQAKVNGYEVPPSHAMACGHLAEPDIAWLFEQETGRLLADPGDYTIMRSKEHPFIGATLDRIQEANQQYPAPEGCAGAGALELKNVNPEWYPLYIDCEQQYRWDPLTRERRLCFVEHASPRAEWAMSPPMHYQAQLQIQMYCADLEWGTLCGKFPGNKIAFKDYKRNDAFIEWAIPQLVAFWDRVQRRDPPPIRRVSSADVVSVVYAEETGETISIDDEVSATALELDLVKQDYTKLEKHKKLLRAQLMSVMGDAAWAALPDGRWLKRMWNKRGYFDLKVVKHKR